VVSQHTDIRVMSCSNGFVKCPSAVGVNCSRYLHQKVGGGDALSLTL
jgi:hypothetical protein